MARLAFRRESRSEDGVTEAVVGSLSMHVILLGIMFWGATHLSMPTPPQIYGPGS
jgi:membrane protein involved in colicin uptake